MRAALVCILAGSALAQGTPRVDDVSNAFAAKDKAALEKLARRDRPDPWTVANELCHRGAFDAAAAFARAAPRPDTKELPRYVKEARRTGPNRSAHEAVAAAAKLVAAGKKKEAFERLRREPVAPLCPDVVRVLHGRAVTLQMLEIVGNEYDAARLYRAASKAAEEIGWLARAARTLLDAGHAARRAGDHAYGHECWRERLRIERVRGAGPGLAEAHHNMGSVLLTLGRVAEALDQFERARALRTAQRDHAGVVRTMRAIATAHKRQGRFAEAVDVLERALAIRPDDAATLRELGGLYLRRGDPDRARTTYRRALASYERAKDERAIARVLHGLGGVATETGEFKEASRHFERALALFEKNGDPGGVAYALQGLGVVHMVIGDPRAEAELERALDIRTRLNEMALVAEILDSLGALHQRRGDYARAIQFMQRALAVHEKAAAKVGVALALNNLGVVHRRLGDHARALDHLQRALALRRTIGSPAHIAETLANLGVLYRSQGKPEQSKAAFVEALALYTKLGNRPGIGVAVAGLGHASRDLDDLDAALAYHERALAVATEIGARQSAARALVALTEIHQTRGDLGKAAAYATRAVAAAREGGHREVEVSTLGAQARIEYERGRYKAALGHLRDAIALLHQVVRGLEDEEGARARESWSGVFELGVAAAMRAGDLDGVAAVMESGRAGSLLEALGGRLAVAAAVPAELRAQEADARVDEAHALAALDAAARKGDRKMIRARRTALQEARTRLQDVRARVQRETKAAATVLYARAASLPQLQAALDADTSLVLYGLVHEATVALVIRRDDARVGALGPTAAIEDAIAALQLDTPDAKPEEALARLRTLLVAPLALETKRVLIAPQGALASLPFGLLIGRPVALVPSGTTYVELRREARGKGVLALGDPAYGGRFTRLPGSRAEAQAVGSTVLLGESATKTRLGAALDGRAWRAVHFACHGVFHKERPAFSALALADGNLTVSDIVGMKIRADLAVLSACETARGKTYRSEGVVGLARAFMLAGTPRVVVSLWKVDDDATRALMTKFYELVETQPTADALAAAQHHVRQQKRWSHPYYWAAWQLWGLPE